MPYYSEILEKISEEFVLEELRTVYINPLSIGWLKDFYARSLAHFNKKETKKIIKTYKL